MIRQPPRSTLFPNTTLSRSRRSTYPPKNTSATSARVSRRAWGRAARSEEHTSELQSRQYLVCRLLLEKKKNTTNPITISSFTTPHHLPHGHLITSIQL